MRFSVKEMYNKSLYNDNNNLRYIFPYLKNKSLYNYLKIDTESLCYISHKNISLNITNIITNHILKYKMSNKDIIITDCTSGVGGDTIQFGQTFKFVYSIEIDKNRYKYLINNTSIYNLKNIKFFNDDLLNILPIISEQDIIFIDPPWGGPEYKNLKNIRLKISNIIELEDLCEMILFGETIKCSLFICLKLPKNYDIKYIYDKLNKCNIYLYELNKMIIIIIEKKNMYIDIFVNKLIKKIIHNALSSIIQSNSCNEISSCS
jgi:16S rRNA G966 N2-methylase RsmD